MRIEVTYIDDSPPPKQRKLHLPKFSWPKLYKTEAHKFELRIPKTFVKVVLSAVVLLVLLVGAGVAYTYFLGSGSALPAGTQTVAAESYKPVTPRAPAPDAAEGVAVSTLSSPVSPGAAASMSVQTLPESTCTIEVTYGQDRNKTQSKAAGLHQVTADAYGTANWDWTVDTSAPLGTWPVVVTCVHNKHSGVVQGDMQVVAPGSASVAN